VTRLIYDFDELLVGRGGFSFGVYDEALSLVSRWYWCLFMVVSSAVRYKEDNVTGERVPFDHQCLTGLGISSRWYH
jgi:hypothetical protein